MHSICKCTILVMLLACGTLSNIRRPTKVTTKCCESVSPAYITYSVTSYKQQNSLGPCVHAIIFETEKGAVCSSPRAKWVQKKMQGVFCVEFVCSPRACVGSPEVPEIP